MTSVNSNMFDVKALISELNYQGLRTARADEAGWYYTAWCGARVWVCERFPK